MTRFFLRLGFAIMVAALLGQLASYFTIERSLRDDVYRTLAGPGRMVARRLSEIPPPQRAAAAERITDTFGYPVRLETETTGKGVFVEWRGDDLALIAVLPDGKGQVALGPVPIGDGQGDFLPSTVVLLMIAVGLVLVAAWPLFTRVRGLESLAARMSEGNFELRSSLDPDEPLFGLATALNRLAARIGQLLSDERDLMRTVSHEVRAPISRMRFRVDMLASASSAHGARHAEGLVSDLKEVDSLFEELLTYVAFDEFDHERPELTKHAFPIGEAVRQVVGEIADTAPHVKLTVEGAGEALVVANRKLFDRAVSNLVRNAVAYCDGEVRVILRSFPSVQVVDVQDDGPGIPEAERPNVIKPFVRLDTGRKVKGTGLGLAIVTRIMRLHHGNLHLLDAPRGGASCQLVWPAPETAKRGWRHLWAERVVEGKKAARAR